MSKKLIILGTASTLAVGGIVTATAIGVIEWKKAREVSNEYVWSKEFKDKLESVLQNNTKEYEVLVNGTRYIYSTFAEAAEKIGFRKVNQGYKVNGRVYRDFSDLKQFGAYGASEINVAKEFHPYDFSKSITDAENQGAFITVNGVLYQMIEKSKVKPLQNPNWFESEEGEKIFTTDVTPQDDLLSHKIPGTNDSFYAIVNKESTLYSSEDDILNASFMKNSNSSPLESSGEIEFHKTDTDVQHAKFYSANDPLNPSASSGVSIQSTNLTQPGALHSGDVFEHNGKWYTYLEKKDTPGFVAQNLNGAVFLEQQKDNPFFAKQEAIKMGKKDGTYDYYYHYNSIDLAIKMGYSRVDFSNASTGNKANVANRFTDVSKIGPIFGSINEEVLKSNALLVAFAGGYVKSLTPGIGQSPSDRTKAYNPDPTTALVTETPLSIAISQAGWASNYWSHSITEIGDSHVYSLQELSTVYSYDGVHLLPNGAIGPGGAVLSSSLSHSPWVGGPSVGGELGNSILQPASWTRLKEAFVNAKERDLTGNGFAARPDSMIGNANWFERNIPSTRMILKKADAAHPNDPTYYFNVEDIPGYVAEQQPNPVGVYEISSPTDKPTVANKKFVGVDLESIGINKANVYKYEVKNNLLSGKQNAYAQTMSMYTTNAHDSKIGFIAARNAVEGWYKEISPVVFAADGKTVVTPAKYEETVFAESLLNSFYSYETDNNGVSKSYYFKRKEDALKHLGVKTIELSTIAHTDEILYVKSDKSKLIFDFVTETKSEKIPSPKFVSENWDGTIGGISVPGIELTTRDFNSLFVYDITMPTTRGFMLSGDEKFFKTQDEAIGASKGLQNEIDIINHPMLLSNQGMEISESSPESLLINNGIRTFNPLSILETSVVTYSEEIYFENQRYTPILKQK